jgi:hypothetical protein
MGLPIGGLLISVPDAGLSAWVSDVQIGVAHRAVLGVKDEGPGSSAPEVGGNGFGQEPRRAEDADFCGALGSVSVSVKSPQRQARP